MIDQRTFFRDALTSAALFAAGALFSFAVSSPSPGLAALWLPSGIYLALLIRAEPRRWAAIVVGALVASVGTELLVNGRGLLPALGLAASHTCQALAGAALLLVSGGIPSTQRVADMFRLLAVAVGASAIPGALIGAFVLAAQYSSNLINAWATLWVANLIGIMVAAPPLLVSRDDWRATGARLSGWRRLELAIALGTLLTVALAVYWLPPHPVRKMYLLLPWVLWVTFRFGTPELLLGALAVVAVNVGGTLAGKGPFGEMPVADASFFMQLSATIGVTCFLILSAALRERERSLLRLSSVEQDTLIRHFADTAPAILWAADPEGRRTFLSRGWQELSGQPSASGLGSGWLQTVHPEDRESAGTSAGAAMRARRPYQIRYRIRSADGSYRWVISAGRPRYDEGGRFLGYVGSLIDVHDHTVATAELASANALLDAVFQSAPVGLGFLDRDTRFRRLNERMAAFNGLPITDHIGRTPQELFPTFADLASVLSSIRDVSASGQPQLDIEVSGETLATTGHVRFWRTSFFPVAVAGERVGVGVVSAEITEQKRAEQELRDSAQRKDEFLAMLAHELRNPLAPIQNAVRLLEVAAPGTAAHATAREIIDRQLSHVVRLVDDLLDASRLSRGKLSIRREPTDLTSVVRETATDLRQSFHDRSIRFEVVLPDRPVWTDGDRTRLAQLIGNLLHNAQKFTPAGGAVRLRMDADVGTATIRVEDTGIGMTAELVARAFDEFSQGNQSLDRASGGLGLGLAIAKRFAELHGGRVEAFSDGPNRGSSFVVHLPARFTTQPVAPADVALSG